MPVSLKRLIRNCTSLRTDMLARALVGARAHTLRGSSLARRALCTADNPYVMIVTVTVPDNRKDEFLQVLDKDIKVVLRRPACTFY